MKNDVVAESPASPDLNTRAEQAAGCLRASIAEPPQAAIVLGSGLNELADRLAESNSRPL